MARKELSSDSKTMEMIRESSNRHKRKSLEGKTQKRSASKVFQVDDSRIGEKRMKTSAKHVSSLISSGSAKEIASSTLNKSASGFLVEFLVDDSWQAALESEFQKDYFLSLDAQLAKEYASNALQTFPPAHLIFNAFNKTPFKAVKVVILGQDPYHNDGQAHGLAFSVAMGTDAPASLKNIYKELTTDITGFVAPNHGCLEKWASNGVFLLNTILTVRAHQPNSHARIGWQSFTDAAISALSQHHSGCVFLLWGKAARRKQALIDATKHRIICTAHPSPLSFGKFIGCRCFSRVNTELHSLGLEPVDWSL